MHLSTGHLNCGKKSQNAWTARTLVLMPLKQSAESLIPLLTLLNRFIAVSVWLQLFLPR